MPFNCPLRKKGKFPKMSSNWPVKYASSSFLSFLMCSCFFLFVEVKILLFLGSRFLFFTFFFLKQLLSTPKNSLFSSSHDETGKSVAISRSERKREKKSEIGRTEEEKEG